MNYLQTNSQQANQYRLVKLDRFIGCIVVQGVSNKEYIEEIKRGWEGFQLIFSTWEDTDKSLYNDDDIVIYNTYPNDRGVSNLGCQKVSTQSGLMRAKELGWERAVKWRSDQWPTNGKELYKEFRSGGINLYSWMNHNGGYINDYFMEGPIDSLIDLYEVEANGEFPEKNLTKRFYERELNVGAECIVKRVSGKTDIYSGKWDLWLGGYVTSVVYGDEVPKVWK